MNTSLKKIPLNTYLFKIKGIIEGRHGRVKELRVCLGRFEEGLEMGDDMKTLEEYFNDAKPKIQIPSGEPGEPELEVKVYYDFKPFDCEEPNPILLDWNC